ncbi:MAG: RCC1 domain-containing protein [Bacteroidetes bacterium]|nr:RCC1 domain-containing protein [Bacteroidota bacterium]
MSSDMIRAILTPGGTVWTWGWNYTGALGNGTHDDRDTPGRVSNLSGIISLDQSFGAVVAADKDGNVWFWGNLWIYEGPPDTDKDVLVPIKLASNLSI